MQSPPPHVFSCVKRPQTVQTKGRWDFTLRLPTGRKLRSAGDIRDYLHDLPGVSLDAALFNFGIPWAAGAPPINSDLVTDAGNPNLITDAGNVVIDGATPNLAEDDKPDLIENGGQGSPESYLSPAESTF